MDLYPAIDLRGGCVVQLVGGDFDRETIHADDPVAVALGFEAAGAPWLHVVDLDAARTGEPRNQRHIAAIAAAVSVPVQASGGVRTVEAAAALADAGVARVVVGTAAIEDEGLVGRIAARQPVAVGLDIRGRDVSVRGWTVSAGVDVAEALRRLEGEGVAAVAVTQIQGEGLMGGPDFEGLREILASTSVPVVASGGVGSIADLCALAALDGAGRRLSGAIVGTALYERRFTAQEAVAALSR